MKFFCSLVRKGQVLLCGLFMVAFLTSCIHVDCAGKDCEGGGKPQPPKPGEVFKCFGLPVPGGGGLACHPLHEDLPGCGGAHTKCDTVQVGGGNTDCQCVATP